MGNDTMKEDFPDNDQRLAVCYSQWRKEKGEEKQTEGLALERRYVELEEFRFDEDGNTLSGYAAVFNKWSEDLGWFREKIKPGAFKKTIKEADIRALINHDANLVLGRSTTGTLELKEDEKGLFYKVSLPDTSYARDLKESIRRGDITQNSFGFLAVKDEWNERGDERTLLEAKLIDVSPVTFPAYPQTTLMLRNIIEGAGLDYRALAAILNKKTRGEEFKEEDIETLKKTAETIESLIPEIEEPVEQPAEGSPEQANADLQDPPEAVTEDHSGTADGEPAAVDTGKLHATLARIKGLKMHIDSIL
jgi:HK97 family phage prohead protease